MVPRRKEKGCALIQVYAVCMLHQLAELPDDTEFWTDYAHFTKPDGLVVAVYLDDIYALGQQN